MKIKVFKSEDDPRELTFIITKGKLPHSLGRFFEANRGVFSSYGGTINNKVDNYRRYIPWFIKQTNYIPSNIDEDCILVYFPRLRISSRKRLTGLSFKRLILEDIKDRGGYTGLMLVSDSDSKLIETYGLQEKPLEENLEIEVEFFYEIVRNGREYWAADSTGNSWNTIMTVFLLGQYFP